MDQFENNIMEMVEAYCDSTGIGLLYLDRGTNIQQARPSGRTLDELRKLEFDELIIRLRLLTDTQTESGNYFETFITEHHFLYNIRIMRMGRSIHCFLITEPMIIQQFSEQTIQEICLQRNYKIAEKIEMTRILKTVPVVSWERVHQLGMVLHLLCNSILKSEVVYQSFYDANQDFADSDLINDKIESILISPLEIEPIEFTIYLKIKKIIQSGDIDALSEFGKTIDFWKLPFHHLGNQEFLRAVQDYFIMFCTMQFYCAVDAGMCFPEMVTLAVKLINEAEQMKQANEVFAHMKLSLATFTHAVNNFNKQRHSKPIQALLAYIHDHYSEKISLTAVSKHVGLNPSYLSSLIHKETGRSLADNINRIRVEASKMELLNTNRSINDIAQSVGFSYQNHYAKVFKKLTGTAPLAFRERKNAELIKNKERSNA